MVSAVPSVFSVGGFQLMVTLPVLAVGGLLAPERLSSRYPVPPPQAESANPRVATAAVFSPSGVRRPRPRLALIIPLPSSATLDRPSANRPGGYPRCQFTVMLTSGDSGLSAPEEFTAPMEK